MLQHAFSKASNIFLQKILKIVFQKITDTIEDECCKIPLKLQIDNLKCIASQWLSPPCVLFFLGQVLFLKKDHGGEIK